VTVKQAALGPLAARRDWINIFLTEKEILLGPGGCNQEAAFVIVAGYRGE
jgi:hypothetical protein